MRKICALAAMLAAYAMLAGCDKCSHGLQDIRLPLPSQVCSR